MPGLPYHDEQVAGLPAGLQARMGRPRITSRFHLVGRTWRDVTTAWGRFRSFRVGLMLLCLIPAAVLLAGADLAVSDAQIDRVGRNFGLAAKERVTKWRTLFSSQENQRLPEPRKLELVNGFMNQVSFVSDLEHWGKEDYWATPLEFLASGGGDCEDFAIAKYFTLRALGVPDERLRITYATSLKLRQAHIVLAYYVSSDSEPLILDNLVPEILPASRRPDLLPIYSFNGAGLWLAKEQSGRSRSVGGSDRMSLWQDLQMRMRAP
jgi:predicted transglutaminase-like cysteine proteinase